MLITKSPHPHGIRLFRRSNLTSGPSGDVARLDDILPELLGQSLLQLCICILYVASRVSRLVSCILRVLHAAPRVLHLASYVLRLAYCISHISARKRGDPKRKTSELISAALRAAVAAHPARPLSPKHKSDCVLTTSTAALQRFTLSYHCLHAMDPKP